MINSHETELIKYGNEWYSLDIVNWMPENHDFSAFSCFIKFQSPRNVYLVVFLKNKNGTMRLIVIYYSIISSILIFKDYATFEIWNESWFKENSLL